MKLAGSGRKGPKQKLMQQRKLVKQKKWKRISRWKAQNRALWKKVNLMKQSK